MFQRQRSSRFWRRPIGSVRFSSNRRSLRATSNAFISLARTNYDSSPPWKRRSRPSTTRSGPTTWTSQSHTTRWLHCEIRCRGSKNHIWWCWFRLGWRGFSETNGTFRAFFACLDDEMQAWVDPDTVGKIWIKLCQSHTTRWWQYDIVVVVRIELGGADLVCFGGDFLKPVRLFGLFPHALITKC